MDGWREPEDQDRAEAEDRQRRERAQIELEAHPVGERVLGDDRVDHVKPAGGPRRPERAAGEREQRALDEQLAYDAPAGGAERRAHGHLVAPRRRAHQEHVRGVRTGNQQHHDGDEHERDPDGVGQAAQVALVDRHGAQRDAGIRRGVLARQRLGRRGERRPNRAERRLVLHARDDVERAREAALGRDARHRRERQPDVGDVGKSKRLAHHADNRRRRAVHADRSPDDGRIGAVAGSPDAGGEDGGRRRARSIVGRLEIASHERPLAEHPERRGGHVGRQRAIGRAIVVAEHGRRARERRHVAHAGRRGADAVELAVRERDVAAVRVARAEEEDAADVRNRQAAHADGVDEHPLQVRRADSEAEHRRDHDRERALSREEPRGEADVAPEILRPRGHPDVARAVRGERAAPERPLRRCRGFRRRHAFGGEAPLRHRPMEGELLGEIVVETAPPQPPAHAAKEITHGPLPSFVDGSMPDAAPSVNGWSVAESKGRPLRECVASSPIVS